VIAALGVAGLVRKRYAAEPTDFILLTSVVCSLGMLFLVNCDIGMVADWDLASPFTVPLILYAIWILARRVQPGIRLHAMRIGVIALSAHTILWMWTLADDDASIGRLQAMQNRNTFSIDGLHYTTMNFMRYYGRTVQTEKGLAVMHRLVDHVLPDDPRGYFTLAQIYIDQKQRDEALEVLAKSIARNAADYRIESLYANMLRERGEVRGAIRHYRAYMEKLPREYSDSADVSIKILYLGVCYTQADSLQRAIETMETALRWNPGNAHASLMLAQLYLGTNRVQDALPLIERAAGAATDPSLKNYADSLLRRISDAGLMRRDRR
jgi:tetratricopeptide (TPR) repeat protein